MPAAGAGAVGRAWREPRGIVAKLRRGRVDTTSSAENIQPGT